MKCPICSRRTSVIDSRQDVVTMPDVIRRRRECETCRHRFSTYEIQAAEFEKETRLTKRQIRIVMLRAVNEALKLVRIK